MPTQTIPPHKTDTPQQFIVEITPHVAETWLGHNLNNRPLNNAHVEKLAGAITRNEWVFDGSPIRFDTEGNVVDGQHRLWAVIEADLPITAVVITGLEPDARLTVDGGGAGMRRRGTADTLRMAGHRDATRLAATVNHFWRWQVAESIRSSKLPTIQQALDVLAEHPGLEPSLHEVQNRVCKRFRLAAGVIAATHYVFASIDSETCQHFFDHLLTGEGLEAGSPILVLRQYLEGQLIAGSGSRANKIVHQALFIKAWNAYRDNETVTVLNWKSGGMRAEAFPVPH